MSRRSATQPDLFAGSHGAAAAEDEDAAYLDAVRERLNALLAKVRTAESLPFPDATTALLAELEFARAVRRLPRDEAEPLHRAFFDEIWRLYAIEEGLVPPPPRPDGWCVLPLDDPPRNR